MNCATSTLTTPTPAAVAAPRRAVPVVTWLGRLAAWAERQPRHRRAGSWLLTLR